jgi:hypothetical protein
VGEAKKNIPENELHGKVQGKVRKVWKTVKPVNDRKRVGTKHVMPGGSRLQKKPLS